MISSSKKLRKNISQDYCEGKGKLGKRLDTIPDSISPSETLADSIRLLKTMHCLLPL